MQTTYDGQKYLSASLFNFKTDKYNKTMELVSQADLGKKMSMLSITNQIDDANYTEIKNIKVSTSCLASNTNIKKVKVDNMVAEIQTSAFSGDTSLEQVTLYDGNQLELIGANAFNGCANLTIFDFANNTAGWKCNGEDIDVGIIGDKYAVCTYLTSTWVSYVWEKIVKNKNNKSDTADLVKLTLRVYRDNIWDVFSITGIVEVGLVVAIILTAPVIASLVQVTLAKVVSSATSVAKSGFDASAFIQSFNGQFKSLNWGNPIVTLQSLLSGNSIYRIIMQAIVDSDFQTEVLEQMKETATVCANDLVKGIKDQLVVIFICVGVSSLVAFFASRLVIQLRNSENRHVGKFILSFTLNLLTVGLVYFLMIISLVNEIPAVGLVFIFLGIFVLLLVLTLIWATLCYKSKEQKFTDVFNVMTMSKQLLSVLIVLAISAILFIILYFASELISLVIAIPLIMITNIIIENIAMKYVCHFGNKIVNKTKTNVKTKNKHWCFIILPWSIKGHRI